MVKLIITSLLMVVATAYHVKAGHL